MGSTIVYQYDGSKALTKYFGDKVVLEKEWVEAMQQFFGSNGYDLFLSWVKKTVMRECSSELTDAQAWLLIHHLTNQGVPIALQDKDLDESNNPAKYVAYKALGVMESTTTIAGGAVAGVVGGVASAVAKPFRGKPAEEVPTEEWPQEPSDE